MGMLTSQINGTEVNLWCAHCDEEIDVQMNINISDEIAQFVFDHANCGNKEE